MSKSPGHCVECGVSFAELGLPRRGGRKLCPSQNCIRKYNADRQRERYTTDAQAVVSSAYRTQGQFRVPDAQHGLAKKFTDEFFCWMCHKKHDAVAVKDLRIECVCGALYTLSLGEAPAGVAIVRVDRWR